MQIRLKQFCKSGICYTFKSLTLNLKTSSTYATYAGYMTGCHCLVQSSIRHVGTFNFHEECRWIAIMWDSSYLLITFNEGLWDLMTYREYRDLHTLHQTLPLGGHQERRIISFRHQHDHLKRTFCITKLQYFTTVIWKENEVYFLLCCFGFTQQTFKVIGSEFPGRRRSF